MDTIEYWLLVGILVYIAFVLREIRKSLDARREADKKAADDLRLCLAKIERYLAPLPIAPYKTTSKPLPLPE
jgi:hypothetical protein